MHDFLVKEWNLQYEPHTFLFTNIEYRDAFKGVSRPFSMIGLLRISTLPMH